MANNESALNVVGLMEASDYLAPLLAGVTDAVQALMPRSHVCRKPPLSPTLCRKKGRGLG
ncbi:hypothetical protein [Aeromonas sp.]|uniref:hypothetical protein n=1 Tax=Aeromonas sp. TaxID=647 RepID=UPI00258BC63D|nr:hypothetical protein [Aeromonas sp.]MCX7128281.1 hypothetical protein [Aeromonas sp.]